MTLRLCDCPEFDGADPALKPPNERLAKLHYVKHGPVQPVDGFVRSVDGRSFRAEWYVRFPWLEYSMAKAAAFCFYCRLFAVDSAVSSSGGQVDAAFISGGFNCWKKALEKGRGFLKHGNSQSHAFAVKAYQTFVKAKPVDTQLSEERERELSRRQETVRRNRTTLQRIFNVVRFIARLSLPFRGHDETHQSLNRGVFVEVVTYLAENGDQVLASHLSEAAANATYLGPVSQNEMIAIVGAEIQREVVRRASAAKQFTVMMDETTDVSHREQVAIYIRYLLEDDVDCVIEERLLALVDTAETTGEALASLLLDTLAEHQLDIHNVVGQGYDGGSNMRGSVKGVQARVKQVNPTALFTHCFAHNLNRALVNAVCDASMPDVRNFFGTVELLFTFVEGSAARHAYFIGVQRESNPDDPALHLQGLSDTRWNCRASSLRRLATERVLRAALATIEHVSSTTTDGTVRGTAAGLLLSVSNYKFLLSLQLLTPVMEAVNNVSQTLQSSTMDIVKAQQQVRALSKELQRLRDDSVFAASTQRATELATTMGIDAELPAERQRKIPRRLDDNAGNAANLSPLDKMRTNFYVAIIDKLSTELTDRFPSDLMDFACLDPRYFNALDAELQLRRLASRYGVDADTAASQWRLSHQFLTVEGDIDLLALYRQLPQTYNELRMLYKVLLTLPVTTASVERGFSKLSIVKSKLRSTMGQGRLQSLILAAVERDIVTKLNDEDLVARFASQADRRLLL